MERLKQRVRPVSWWSLGFLMLITSLLLSVFVAPLARAADDTYSVADGKITIQSEIFIGGTYTDGDNPQIKCSPNAATAIVAISQESKNKIKNGETPDVIRYSITPNGGAANNSSCPSGDRTAQYMEDTDGDSIDNAREACAIEGFGWAICGPSMWIAKGMDTVYGWLEGFLEIQPLETTNTSSIVYQAWDIMRGFANAAFIIAFIFIIYSQITSVGISNYGIKKLAPRLVVAAILVNLSFYICSIGIDLANIAGHGVKNIFDNILLQLLEGSTAGATDTNANRTGDIIQAVLSGTTVTIAGASVVGASLLAASPFILILLLGLFVSGLVALLVLSARQAILIILVIISPLAFVAYLLPGTEKWFEKWRNTLLILLIFFPAFAAVFGGANLAGIIISETAGSSVIRFVLGWAVQLAPLAITPMIMKLGGGVLNRFAGIVNDPTKGFMDKAKQRARDKSQDIANRRTYGNKKLQKGWRRYTPRGVAHNARLREQYGKKRLEESENMAANAYNSWDQAKRQDIRSRRTKDQGDLLQQRADNRYDEMKAGQMPSDLKIREVPEMPEWMSKNRLTRSVGSSITSHYSQQRPQADGIQATYSSIAAEGFRKANAQRELNAQFAEEVLKNESLQKQAGGNVYEGGAQAAMAAAVATKKADVAKTIEEGQKLLQHFELSAEQIHQHALGEKPFIDPTTGKATYTITNKDGHSYTFDPAESNLTHEAAIDTKFKTGTVAEIAEIIAKYPSEDRMSVAAGLAASSIKNKAPFLGGRLVNEITKNTVNSQATLDDFIVNTWAKGEKWSSVDLASMDSDATTLLMNAIKSVGIDKDTKETLQMRILEMQDDPDLYSRVTEKARKGFEDILNL